MTRALSALLVAVVVALVPAAAQAQAVPPIALALVLGQIPAPGTAGLLVVSRDTGVSPVLGELRVRGCEAESIAVIVGGRWRVYIAGGAPAAVNAAFEAAVPQLQALTAFFVRCGAGGIASGVQGTVTLGPTMPVCRIDTPCDRPYEAVLVILDASGREAARVQSGVDGRYRVVLGAGSYVINPLSPPGQTLPRAAPVRVDVPPGAFVTVDIAYDSGIR